MVAAALALLAFLLAFIRFGLGSARCPESLVIDEANAIGTTYLRADLLHEPRGRRSRPPLPVRGRCLEAVQPGNLEQSIRRSEKLHAELWSRGRHWKKHQGSIVVGLFIASANELIDLHTKRLAMRALNRLPGPIWAALDFVAIIATAVMGYHSGLSGARRSPAILAQVLAFSAVMPLDRRSRPAPRGIPAW